MLKQVSKMTATVAEPPKVPSNKNESNRQKLDNENLDLVRNILFGEQVKKAEERRMQLEKMLDLSISSLREETDKKFDNVAEEISALISLLTDETKARQSENSHSQTKFSHLSHQISQLDIKTQKAQSQLQERVVNESSKHHQAIRRVNEDITLKLEQAIEQLQYDKADRKALAGLLSGVAKQLLDSKAER